jgi:hypothetical protein
VIPERVYTRRDYESAILRVIAKDVERLDRAGILDPEWVNSRGAIARFGRGSIEIRVIDAQESAASSVAVAAAAVAVVRALVEERWATFDVQRDFHETALEPLFSAAVVEGGSAVVSDERLLSCFGAGPRPCSARELWAHLAAELDVRVDGGRAALDVILRQGSLSERILRTAGPEPSAGVVHDVYQELANCLRDDRPFSP